MTTPDPGRLPPSAEAAAPNGDVRAAFDAVSKPFAASPTAEHLTRWANEMLPAWASTVPLPSPAPRSGVPLSVPAAVTAPSQPLGVSVPIAGTPAPDLPLACARAPLLGLAFVA
jgi:hypothetical protein